MAASGAAPPSLTRFGKTSGNPAPVNYSKSYARPIAYSGDVGYEIAKFRGPGTLTSLTLRTHGIVSVGFQCVNMKANAGPQPLLPGSLGAGGWLGANNGPQTVEPAMTIAYVYPIQELLNYSVGYAGYADISGSAPTLTVSSTATGAPTFVAGQQLQFQSSFANGFASVVSVPSTTTAILGTVSYSYFSTVGFDDELRIFISPLILNAVLWAGTTYFPTGDFPYVILTATVEVD